MQDPKRANHLKMLVIEVLKANVVSNIVEAQINLSVELTTYGSSLYTKLGEYIKSHHAQVLKPEDHSKILPLVHIAISNVKRLLLDAHHQNTKEYLYYYLNEFWYKFNRLYFCQSIYDRVIFFAASYNTDFMLRFYNRSVCE